MAETPTTSGPNEATAPARAAGGARFRYSADRPVVAADSTAAVGVMPLRTAALDWQRVSIGLAVAAVCLVILYRSELLALVDVWNSDPGWSHGFVVPLISGSFVWTKWETLRQMKPQGT